MALGYDRVVLSAGSHVRRPPLPGLAEHAFSVDTYLEAQRLGEHLRSLEGAQPLPTRYSAAVVGAGLTGLEVATELVGRLGALARQSATPTPVAVTLINSAPEIGPDLGPAARAVIEQALRGLGVELRLGDRAVAVGSSGVTLESGEHVGAATTVWTQGCGRAF